MESAPRDTLLDDLPKAIIHWRRTDPAMARLAEAHPPEPWPAEHREPFVALCASIISQQVSLAAGRTIYGRFADLVGPVTPENVLRVDEDALRGAGLSRQKAAYLRDLAGKAAAGDVAFDRFPDMDDDAVTAQLTAVKGIGVWTAKMFLLFSLGRPDVSAPEDLGLRLGVARFYGVPESEAAAVMRDKAAAWSPYNTLAARVLWTARGAPES